MRRDDSLATILLAGRLGAESVDPLRAREFWRLIDQGVKPGDLLGSSVEKLCDEHGLAEELASRVVALLDRGMGMAFELERLDQSGISTLTPFDEGYPTRLRDRLGTAAPVLLHAAGGVELLQEPGVGVVGSRDVTPEGAHVAREAAELAARLGRPLVSGGARGADQIAMSAAFEAGGGVVGVLADSLARKLRSQDIRRAIYDGRAVMCTPYNPEAPFNVGNAMGRNKLIYALSDLTLVVAADAGTGGTWSGAEESLKRCFGRVAVWRGPGEGPGNDKLAELGAQPITSLDDLEAAVIDPEFAARHDVLEADRVSAGYQLTLGFD